MFCSTIIPTINRDTLSRSVQSVLDQKFDHDDFEIIVVNDSGEPLPPAEWQQSEQVRVLTTNRREKCVARNAGAAIARGRYLHFLDDDDWLLPGAFNEFWALANKTDAEWMYGGACLVEVNTGVELLLHLKIDGNCFMPALAGEWIPLQVSMIKSKNFFAVGGFNHLMTEAEDKELFQRIALKGMHSYTPQSVAVIQRDEVRTRGYPLGAKQFRREREKTLNETGVFARMRASATSDYWYGRIIRIYLVSTIWNLKEKRIFTAASRAVFSLLSFISAGSRLFAADFWRAVTKSHNSNVTSL